MRGESAWRAFATSSLPVPLSPVMSTVEAVGATDRTRSKTAAIAWETPRMLSRPWRDAELGLEPAGSPPARSWLSRAPRTTMLQLLDVEGLGEVVVGPELHGGHRRLRGAVGGHDDDHGLRRGRLHVAQDLDAVPVGQTDVGDDHVGGSLAKGPPRPGRGCPPSPPRSLPWRSMMASISRMEGSSSTTRILCMGRSVPSYRPQATLGGAVAPPPGEATPAAGAPPPRSPARPGCARRCRPGAPARCGRRWRAPAPCRWRSPTGRARRCAAAPPGRCHAPRPARAARAPRPRCAARCAAGRPSGMASRPFRARFQITWVIWSGSARQTCGPSPTSTSTTCCGPTSGPWRRRVTACSTSGPDLHRVARGEGASASRRGTGSGSRTAASTPG